MLWVQAGVCFLVWVGYGIWMRGRSERLKSFVSGWSRGKRVAFASVGLIGGMALMLGGIAAVSALGGIQSGTLTPWAWLLCMLIGLGFVHLQVLAASAMITLVLEEETERRSKTSIPKEPTQS